MLLSPLYFVGGKKSLALSGLAELSLYVSKAKPGLGPQGVCASVINHDSHLPICDYELLDFCERLCVTAAQHMAD